MCSGLAPLRERRSRPRKGAVAVFYEVFMSYLNDAYAPKNLTQRKDYHGTHAHEDVHERRGTSSRWQAPLVQQCHRRARLVQSVQNQNNCVASALHTAWQPSEHAWTCINTTSNRIEFVNEKSLLQLSVVIRAKSRFQKDDTYFFNAMLFKMHVF